jgi:hypothetical protein
MRDRQRPPRHRDQAPGDDPEPGDGRALRDAAERASAADAEIDRILSGDSEQFLQDIRQHGGQ